MNDAAVILFHAPPDQVESLLEILRSAEIQWTGKALIFCDCDDAPGARVHFREKGASTAVARQFGIPGRILVAGNGGALTSAHRIARELKLKAIEVLPDATDLFDAAVTLGSCAITPLIDCAATLLREAGIRDGEAARIASALFSQTASEYARSGKQSWAWYMRKPQLDRVEAQIAAVGGLPRRSCGNCCCLGWRLSTNTRRWRGSFRKCRKGNCGEDSLTAPWQSRLSRLTSPVQGHDCGAMTAGFERSIPVIQDERCAGENGAHHFPLYSDAAAVNNTQSFEAQPVSFGEVLFNHRFHVAGRNAVQVEDVGYGDSDGDFGIGHKKKTPGARKASQRGFRFVQRA